MDAMLLKHLAPVQLTTLLYRQAFATVASGLGLKRADKLIFGTVDGVKLAGFVETFHIFEGLPRVVVLVGSLPRSWYCGIIVS